MTNLKQKVTEKAKAVTSTAKEFVEDNKGLCILCGSVIGVVVVSSVLGRKHDEKIQEICQAALDAYKNGNLDYDFGPYKVIKFIEPKTGEMICETMCHESWPNAILELNN